VEWAQRVTYALRGISVFGLLAGLLKEGDDDCV